MYTQCPECKTIFGISEQIIEAADGMVCCSQCSHTYDARATLMEELPEIPAATRTIERAMSDEPAEALPDSGESVTPEADEQPTPDTNDETAQTPVTNLAAEDTDEDVQPQDLDATEPEPEASANIPDEKIMDDAVAPETETDADTVSAEPAAGDTNQPDADAEITPVATAEDHTEDDDLIALATSSFEDSDFASELEAAADNHDDAPADDGETTETKSAEDLPVDIELPDQDDTTRGDETTDVAEAEDIPPQTETDEVNAQVSETPAEELPTEETPSSDEDTPDVEATADTQTDTDESVAEADAQAGESPDEEPPTVEVSGEDTPDTEAVTYSDETETEADAQAGESPDTEEDTEAVTYSDETETEADAQAGESPDTEEDTEAVTYSDETEIEAEDIPQETESIEDITDEEPDHSDTQTDSVEITSNSGIAAEISTDEIEPVLDEADEEAEQEDTPATDETHPEEPPEPVTGSREDKLAARYLERMLGERDDENKHAYGWALGIALLIIVLTAQYGYLIRDNLAQSPHLRPWVEKLCKVAGCQLALRSDLTKLKLVQQDVRSHPDKKNVLLINAVFVNTASFPQAYPGLRFRLSDVNERPVGERVFSPQEYLVKTVDTDVSMEPQVPVHAVFELLDPGKDAVNYEFDFKIM